LGQGGIRGGCCWESARPKKGGVNTITEKKTSLRPGKKKPAPKEKVVGEKQWGTNAGKERGRPSSKEERNPNVLKGGIPIC